MFISRVLADLRSAWRGVVAGRWGTRTAIAALAVGVGVSVTASSAAFAGLLRPLPCPDETHLVAVDRVFTPTGLVSAVSLDELDRWRARFAPFMTLAGTARDRVTLRG